MQKIDYSQPCIRKLSLKHYTLMKERDSGHSQRRNLLAAIISDDSRTYYASSNQCPGDAPLTSAPFPRSMT